MGIVWEAWVCDWAAEPEKEPETLRQGSPKLPPQACKKCKFLNEYIGPEHLQEDGTYLCRDCK